MAAADAHPMFSGVPAVLEFSEYLVDTYEEALQDAAGRCVNQLDIMVKATAAADVSWRSVANYIGAFEEDGDLALGVTEDVKFRRLAMRPDGSTTSNDIAVFDIVKDLEYGTGPVPPTPVLRMTMVKALPVLAKTFDKTLERWY